MKRDRVHFRLFGIHIEAEGKPSRPLVYIGPILILIVLAAVLFAGSSSLTGAMSAVGTLLGAR